ncbi:PTS glucose transporter subunit IIA [Arthrobacter alpinus]|nr:PTS glucose transporter subunit IIA [Arthrobacter alpinus]
MLIGTAAAIVIAFLLTFFFGPRETPDTVDAGSRDAAVDGVTAGATSETDVAAEKVTGNVVVLAPVTGTAVALSEVPDKVFASGAMGTGLAFIPEQDTVHSPFRVPFRSL